MVLLVLAAVCANVATPIFPRARPCANRESSSATRCDGEPKRVIAQIVTESLVLSLAATMSVVAQTTVRYAWVRASQIMGDLPFWVRRRSSLPPSAYALLLALVAAPALDRSAART